LTRHERAVVALEYTGEKREVTRPLSRTTCAHAQFSTWAEAPQFLVSGVAEEYRARSSNRDIDDAR
jgi:hypothetical protein